MKYSILFGFALLPFLTIATEPEATISFQGFSGLINSPTAKLFDEGKFYLQYGNQVETRGGYRDGSNYNFGVGLWEYVEISARLADYDFGSKNGLTDLSANIKLGVPYIPKDWFSLALGIQDLGGAVNFFDAKYIVASKNIFDNVNISLGVGESDSRQGRLDGTFAGIAWQPYEWVKLSVEYDAADTHLGLYLASPDNWHNSGIQLTTELLVSSSNQELKDDFYYGLGLTVPLDFNRVNRASKNNINRNANESINKSKNSNEVTVVREYPQSDDFEPGTVENSGSFEQLRVKKLLIEEGFESIKVDEVDLNTIYVELENHIYNRNQIDGIGIALGIISKNIQYKYSHFKLVLKEREIPIIVLKGNLDEYLAFLTMDFPLKLDISTDTFVSQRRKSTSDSHISNDFWLKPRFTFWPGIASRIGTEVGVFDVSLALISHLELPLWRGAAVTAQHTTQVAETKNFKDDAFFSDGKQKTGLEEYSFHQTFTLPYALKNMTFFGRYRDTYNYFANEIIWQSDSGIHKFNLLTASYENQVIPERRPFPNCNILFVQCYPAKSPQQRDVVIGKYRYYNAKFNTSAVLSIGQYWQQDKGVVFKIKRMFGDVSLDLIYKNTKLNNDKAIQFVGLGFTIPLTPRKDYSNKYVQVRGRPQLTYSVNTVVGEDRNDLTLGTGDGARLFYNLDSAFYNNDRLNREYIYANKNRLRQAFHQMH
jgi:hypothetical protein